MTNIALPVVLEKRVTVKYGNYGQVLVFHVEGNYSSASIVCVLNVWQPTPTGDTLMANKAVDSNVYDLATDYTVIKVTPIAGELDNEGSFKGEFEFTKAFYLQDSESFDFIVEPST